VERKNVQDSLDKHSARLTELQTTLQKLSQFPRAELTVAQNKERTAVEKDDRPLNLDNNISNCLRRRLNRPSSKRLSL